MTGPGRGIAALLVLLLLCTACGPGVSSPETAPAPEAPPASVSPGGEAAAPASGEAAFTYTNLASPEAAETVRAALTGAGVPSEAADEVLGWAADYNGCMAEALPFVLAGDPVTAAGPVVDYGEYPPMSRAWYQTNGRDYHDLLCRVAAFRLDRQNITVARPIDRADFDCWDSETSWLWTDGDIFFGREASEGERACRPNPLLGWPEDTVADYFTLFDPVPLPGEPEEAAMLAAVREQWQQRGVSFREDACALVTLWTLSGGRLGVAHAALLAETGEGLLLFEKTNPESPYSAAWFPDAAGVGQYLYEMMALDCGRYDMEVGPCLLLRNDRPLLPPE